MTLIISLNSGVSQDQLGEAVYDLVKNIYLLLQC